MARSTTVDAPTTVEGEDFRGFTPEEFTARVKEVELQELGHTLPIGVWLEGERQTNVTLRELTGDDEAVLRRHQKNASGEKAINYIAEFLSRAVTHIGDHTLAEVAVSLGHSSGGKADVKRFLKGMYLGDVLTLAAIVKVETSGSAVAMAGDCPKCGHTNADDPNNVRHMHNIDGLTIKTWTDNQPPVLRYQLPRPHAQGESDPIEFLQMHPLKYHHLAQVTGVDAKDTVDWEMLYRVVKKIEHPAYENMRGQVMDVTLLKSMHNINRQMLVRQVNVLDLMPIMEGDMVCERCTNEWKAPIPWPDLATFLFSIADL